MKSRTRSRPNQYLKNASGWPWTACFGLCLLLLTGCRQDMHDQPRYEALEASTFFGDGRASRPLVPGTIARGHLQTDRHFYAGKIGDALADTFPFPITRQVLERGRERFNIFCAPCHDRLGNGLGMVVQRGFRRPPSFHSERFREVPVGHFFDVMTNGFGAMADYSTRVSPRDRWAIAAYIRALQYSQRAALADVPEDKRALMLGASRCTTPIPWVPSWIGSRAAPWRSAWPAWRCAAWGPTAARS